MKPFDLEKAKAGAKVCTRDGREARIICFDRSMARFPIIALIKREDEKEDLEPYTVTGSYYSGKTSEMDLMMVSEKKEGWVNVYRHDIGYSAYVNDHVYHSEEKARSIGALNGDYVATIKIEWEE